MVGLVIAIILSVKGHKVGAWITYGICLSLSIMSSIGMANRNRVLYGRSGMTAASVMIFVVSYVVVFCVICFTGNSESSKRRKTPSAYSLATAEEIFNSYTSKEHFECMDVDDSYKLVNKLNDILLTLREYLDDNGVNTGKNLIEHYAFLYKTLSENGKDESDAASSLLRDYNWSLDEAYAKRLASYVANHMNI